MSALAGTLPDEEAKEELSSQYCRPVLRRNSICRSSPEPGTVGNTRQRDGRGGGDGEDCESSEEDDTRTGHQSTEESDGWSLHLRLEADNLSANESPKLLDEPSIFWFTVLRQAYVQHRPHTCITSVQFWK